VSSFFSLGAVKEGEGKKRVSKGKKDGKEETKIEYRGKKERRNTLAKDTSSANPP